MMGLMSYIHKHLLKRGLLDDLLPCRADLGEDTRPALEAAKADLEARLEEERSISKEVAAVIRRLQELDSRNHYGESLRRAFGGR